MTEDAVREAITPRTQHHRTDHDQREVREDGKSVCHRDVVAHSELAADLRLPQCPGDEGAQRADRDQLPEATLLERRKGEAVLDRRRLDVDLPDVPGRSERRAPQDERYADDGEEDGGDAEEAHVERAHPEVEQIASDQGPTANSISSFEAQHGSVTPENLRLGEHADGRGRSRSRARRAPASIRADVGRSTWWMATRSCPQPPPCEAPRAS